MEKVKVVRTYSGSLGNYILTRLTAAPQLWLARCQFTSAEDRLRGATDRPFEIVGLLGNEGTSTETIT